MKQQAAVFSNSASGVGGNANASGVGSAGGAGGNANAGGASGASGVGGNAGNAVLAIEAQGLKKAFKDNQAVDGIDLKVTQGGIYGILGPNGAGKTTTINILATLMRPDAGTAQVFGYDVVREAQQVRQLIGLTGQFASVDENLTATENLVIFGRLLGLSRAAAKSKAAALLEEFALSEAARRPLSNFSGGMRRRLDLAASLIAQPPLIFLDEPTTGLDPRTRNQMWETIRRLVREGSTILLTTQYLDEADQLADRIALIDHGRVVAEDTPSNLKASIGAKTLDEVFLALTGNAIDPLCPLDPVNPFEQAA
ncbi:MAG: ATP-binding cassette domain-containing protein [Coriobacteriales bacterium]|jgi:ABC-2 type transport system ATP-binding protein|nr:ATP-binding cassette domain-containing protein [Coriobacteriales bacterium]